MPPFTDNWVVAVFPARIRNAIFMKLLSLIMRFKRFWFLTTAIVLASAASGVTATLVVLSNPASDVRRRSRGVHIGKDDGSSRRQLESGLPVHPQLLPPTAPVYPPLFPLVAPPARPSIPSPMPQINPAHTTVLRKCTTSSPTTLPADSPQIKRMTGSVREQSLFARQDSPVDVPAPPAHTATSETNFATQLPPPAVRRDRSVGDTQVISAVHPVRKYEPFSAHQNGSSNSSMLSTHSATSQTTVTTPRPLPSTGNPPEDNRQAVHLTKGLSTSSLLRECEQCLHSHPPAIREGEDYAGWLRDQAERFNEKASKEFFKFHNPQIAQRFQMSGRIDLHHQKVKEAKALTKEYVDKARQSQIKELKIVAGKGNHTVDGKPVLRRRILEALEEWGIEASLDKKNTGVIIARIPVS